MLQCEGLDVTVQYSTVQYRCSHHYLQCEGVNVVEVDMSISQSVHKVTGLGGGWKTATMLHRYNDLPCMYVWCVGVRLICSKFFLLFYSTVLINFPYFSFEYARLFFL